MFRPTDIKNGFANILGWRQDYDPNNQIDGALTGSEFGQYYQDIHPLLTLNNLRSIAPQFDDITGANQDFSGWLTEKTEASNLNTLQNIYTAKVADKTARNVFEQKALFDGAGRMKDTITSTSSLVGFELKPINSLGATVKIESIGLQFKGVGDVILYLFHSSQNEPLKTITLTRTKSNSMEWFSQDDLYLPYLDDSIDSGGAYYLMYDETELAGQEAINKLRNWNGSPCTTCNNYDTMSYNLWSKYLCVNPFKTESLGGTYEMWDIDNNIYTYETNYGINLKVSVECDTTDIFLENKRNLQTVIGLQMAYDMINRMAYNPEFSINRTNQNFSKNDLLYELNGTESDYVNSISYKLKKAYEAVSVDLTNMSRQCFICKPQIHRVIRS